MFLSLVGNSPKIKLLQSNSFISFLIFCRTNGKNYLTDFWNRKLTLEIKLLQGKWKRFLWELFILAKIYIWLAVCTPKVRSFCTNPVSLWCHQLTMQLSKGQKISKDIFLFFKSTKNQVILLRIFVLASKMGQKKKIAQIKAISLTN